MPLEKKWKQMIKINGFYCTLNKIEFAHATVHPFSEQSILRAAFTGGIFTKYKVKWEKYKVKWNNILKFMFDFCQMIIRGLFFFSSEILWALYQFSQEPLIFLWYLNQSLSKSSWCLVLAVFSSSAVNCSKAAQFAFVKAIVQDASSSSTSFSQTLWNPTLFLNAISAIILCNQFALYSQCIDHLSTRGRLSGKDVDGIGRKRPWWECSRYRKGWGLIL